MGDNPFAVVLADDFCVGPGEGEDGVLAQMVKLYNQFRCSIVAIEEVPADETHKYGVIAGESMKDGLYRITDMVENRHLKTRQAIWRSLAVIFSHQTFSTFLSVHRPVKW